MAKDAWGFSAVAEGKDPHGDSDTWGFSSVARDSIKSRQKSAEDQKYKTAELKKQTDKKKKKQQQEAGVNPFKVAGDIAGGVGNFVKTAVTDVVDSAVGAAKGIGDVAGGQLAANRTDTKTAVVNERNKEWSKRFGSASDDQWKDPAFVKQAQEFAAKTKKIGTVSKEDKGSLKTAQKVDTTKTAFQAAETFLNVATLGAGTAVKQGAKTAVKQGTKALLKEAVKVGGPAVIGHIVKKGGENLIKKAAQETLESGAKKLAKEGAKNAVIGAGYGVTQTGAHDPDAALNDYLINAAYGAGLGAVLPLVGAGAKKGLQKIVGKAPKDKTLSQISEAGGNREAAKLQTQIEKAHNAGDTKKVKELIPQLPSDLQDSTRSALGVGVEHGDINAIINKSIEEQSDKYGIGVPEKVKNFVGDQVDPYRALAKIDDRFAKATGTKRTKINADDSLEDLARRSAASEREAAGLFKTKTPNGASAEDLVKKYKGDSAEGTEFNNYTNAKFLQEIRAKKKNYQLPEGLDDSKLDTFIKGYEAKNPDAITDAATKKHVNDMAVDYMVKSKAMSKAEGEHIKSSYKYAVPLDKIFPDDLERPTVVGKNIGSIAKQTAIQKLETGSSLPISNSFDSMLNRVYKAVSQGNRAKVAQKLLERHEQGLIPNAGTVVAAGNKEARKAIREDIQTLNKGIRHLQNKVTVSNRQMRKIQAELNKLNKEGLNISLSSGGKSALPDFTPAGMGGEVATSQAGKVTTDLVAGAKGIVKEPSKEISRLSRRRDTLIQEAEKLAPSRKPNSGETPSLNANSGRASELRAKANDLQKQINEINKSGVKAIDSATTPSKVGFLDTRKFFKNLIEADPTKLKSVRDKIAVREPKLAAKLDEVEATRTKMESLKAVKTDLKDVVAEFTDDPVTGKQIISGIVNGEGYKIEVPPDIAKALMGMEQQKLPSVLKAFAIAKKPFEVAWTGVLNPVFAAVSATFYDTPMSIINSPQGFRTIGPKAIKEAIKSFRSSSDFQKRLAAEGARPYGGSGASSFIKPDAKSIAAQRNILSNIKYSATHPEVAISKLDIWGGKLANMTRTRVARAAYDDALRVAKKAGEDVKSIEVQKRAMENAALAYRTIMPDFDTMSNLTRQVNSVVPFYAASIAGTRSFGKALRRDPIGTGAKALTLGVAPTVAVTAFSMMQPAGQEFYDDMEKSGNTQTVDNNMIVVLPGAHKDDKTGEWTGIVKIPLAPEFRAMNQTAWRSVRGAMGGKGPDASHIALSLFDSITGGIRTGENPLITSLKILDGQDPRTGEQLVKGRLANLPKAEQVYDTTSGAGKFLAGAINTGSKLIGGKDIASPIQGDKLLSQIGLVGSAAKKDGDVVGAVVGNVGNRVVGAFGEKASSSFYSTYSPIKSRRDKVSQEVTSLVKSGKRNEARRKAEEFNNSLSGSFSTFNKQYSGSDAYDPAWDELMNGLFIRTGEKNFNSRAKK